MKWFLFLNIQKNNEIMCVYVYFECLRLFHIFILLIQWGFQDKKVRIFTYFQPEKLMRITCVQYSGLLAE